MSTHNIRSEIRKHIIWIPLLSGVKKNVALYQDKNLQRVLYICIRGDDLFRAGDKNSCRI